MTERVPRVMHVAESFGGGVATAIVDYARATPQFQHHLVYARRAEAPVTQDVFQVFQNSTDVSGASHFQRIGEVRNRLVNGDFDVVHAHSSLAGAYVRLALPRTRVPIVYTPHCYSFERRDISRGARALFRFAESSLALNTSAYAACSIREKELSSVFPGRARAVFVPNVPPPITQSGERFGQERLKRFESRRFSVVGAGRLSKQKDPGFFLKAVSSLREAGYDIEAIWAGGGEENVEKQLELSNVRVLGWLPREDVLREVSRADLYLHSAAWEGFPIAILETLSLGVPTVARALPSLRELREPIPLINKPSELIGAVSTLQSRWKELPSLYQTVLSTHSRERQASALEGLYSEVITRRALASDKSEKPRYRRARLQLGLKGSAEL